jgi:chorismate synthase
VAAGALAKELLLAFDVTVHSHVIQIGSVRAPERDDLRAEDFAGVDDSPVRCLDPDASEAMVAEINRLRKANESLGGIFEVRAFGAVPGLGSHTGWGAPRAWPRLSVSIQAGRESRWGGPEVAGSRPESHDETSGPRSAAGTVRPPAPAASRADVEWPAAFRAAPGRLDPDQAPRSVDTRRSSSMRP